MVTAALSFGRTHRARERKVRIAKRFRLGAAFLLMMVSGLVWNSFGLFLVALEAEFHWSRSSISGAYGAFALINALTAPLFGYLLGRHDSRRLLAGATLLLALSFALTASVSNLVQYWITFGLMAGLGTHCTSSYAIFTILAGRFRARPATAMAIADAGSGLAAFLGIPVIHLIIVHFGWRSAYLSIGAVIALIGFPIHLLLMDRIKTVQRSQSVDATGGLPVFGFIALIISYFCGSAVYHGLLTQQIALFDQQNISEDTAVWLAAAAGLVVFVWRLASGYVCDMWGPGKTMLIAAFASVITFSTLIIVVRSGESSVLFVYPLVLGIAFGGQQVLLANGARLIVSLSALAGVLSICRFAAGMGMAAGPLIASYLYDLSSGYTGAIYVLILLAMAHFLSFAMISGPKSQKDENARAA